MVNSDTCLGILCLKLVQKSQYCNLCERSELQLENFDAKNRSLEAIYPKKIGENRSIPEGILVNDTRCLKITEKVSFNIASEVSYVYILSGQKLVKNAKNGPFWRVFENVKLAAKQSYQTGQFQ